MDFQLRRPSKASSPVRVAVIGAGASGIASAKCLLDEGIEPVVFEQSAEIGGVWKYAEELPNGGGIAYRSLKTNTSKQMLAFSDFPFPNSAPDFPSRAEVLQYLNDYADKFGVRKFITFNSTIERIEPSEDDNWVVHSQTGVSSTTAHRYNAVIVASGLYQQPIYSQLLGIETFQGKILHSADYKGPAGLEGKRVVVVGVGASGADIAAEVSAVADQVEISTRAGVWFLPHYIGGKPYDFQLTRVSRLIPFRVRMCLFRHLVLNTYKQMGFTKKQLASAMALPEFDVWRARLTPGTPVLKQLLSGAIRMRPGVARIETEGVRFADSASKVDPMSSTTFGPVFSVGASSHPVETLDTRAKGAGRAQRPRPLCPARAEKIGWCRRPPLPVIQIGRAAIGERLMRPLGVVERQIADYGSPREARGLP